MTKQPARRSIRGRLLRTGIALLGLVALPAATVTATGRANRMSSSSAFFTVLGSEGL